ncbi:hypothetical protein ABT56_19970 [Photobacterium aquae]|uniref:Lipoprotein n=1 Tax=Photobacterium aquae TaxID=1195763 RepID=A0A0J1GUK0_9GAMM|nr:hypothetical protein [Photobacterium aquae]KLV03398.1 hypothetical protein ABT56_19970 [Photobacterium aquae]
MKQLLKNAFILSGIILLSGCSIKPYHETVANDAVQFSDQQLDQDEGYSQSLQRMYLLSQANPVKDNNLDSFYLGVNYNTANNASLATASAFAVMGKINVFQLATHSLLNLTYRSSLHPFYEDNILVVIEPVIGGNVKDALYQAKKRSLKIVSDAYKKDGYNTKVFSSGEVGFVRNYDTNFVVPFDDNNDVPYCIVPGGYK